MKPEEFVKRKQAEEQPPAVRWLQARVDFKLGVGAIFDPDTNERFGNWVSDWIRGQDEWSLGIFFRPEDVLLTIDFQIAQVCLVQLGETGQHFCHRITTQLFDQGVG